ncbi:MAG TPA: hypothetical protein VHA06_06260, partial [Candidatus Angelobacter sp.]|nr:hypothetical protein [Candidatus Angelobacter sp.]
SSRYHDSCIEIRNLLAQCTGPQTRIFFFGIGMPVGHENMMTQFEEEDHALHFFNDVLLRSFPHLKNLRLAKIGFSGGLHENMSPTALKVSFQENDFIGDSERNWHGMYPKPVSAVIDCKAGSLMVGVTD